jgi:hypothetical protein
VGTLHERGVPVALRHSLIRHSDVLLVVPGRGTSGGRLPTTRLAVGGTLKDSLSTRIIHQVIEPYGNLDVRTTDATSPPDTEDDHERRDLFKSPNHQEVR